MSKLRVGLLFGGRSEEHEVSIMSARSVFTAADPEKYEIIPVAISKEGYWLDPGQSREILLDETVTAVQKGKDGSIPASVIPFLKERLDLVFPVLHGPYGEDGKIQGLFEVLDIPYVGAGVMSSAIGMDKVIMKELFSYWGLPQAKYKVLYASKMTGDLTALKREIESGIGWPCFIKPANLGSSIGINKVHYPGELEQAIKEGFKHDRKIIIEEFIKGREIECSVLGNEKPVVSLPGEIRPKHEFYDYEAKYIDESTELVIPAPLDDELVEEVKELAVSAFRAIDARGFARVDFFLRDLDNKLILNEINTIPGFTRYSMYPKLWEVSGISYRELIDRLIDLALEWQSEQ